MCTHQRFVFNKYTKTSFLVKCGKCESCLQEKAYKRSFRIKQEVSPDKICLFVTLTYDRASCPFVYKADIDARKDILPIFREYFTRRVPVRTRSGIIKYLDKRYFQLQKLNDIYFPDYESFQRRSVIANLAYRDGHIGVCYYPDVQLFKKRLNINLKRKYLYNGIYKVFSTSEYGSRSGRPHFHLLFFIPSQDESIFRTAISEAWPFASHRRTQKYIQIARDCANYVASYVNCGANLHQFLSKNCPPKHSYSKDFGMANKLFSFSSILEKVDKRDLSYLRSVGVRGKESYVNFCIPKYVINRYFPLFKGYSRFTDAEVLDVLRCFIQPGTKQALTPLISLDKLLSIDFTKDDLRKISVRLTNSFIKSGLSKEDYIYKFVDTWKCYRNTNLRLWYEDYETDPKYKYDNTQQLLGGLISSDSTRDYLLSSPGLFYSDPNDYPPNVLKTNLYKSIYHFRSKEKDMNNYVMAKNNYCF